ncbi:MAG: hypothetical protein AABY46_05280 [Nitrospirota bacterium]
MNEKQKGSATLLTLFVSAMLITVGIGFNGMVKEHLKAAEDLKVKTEAMLRARSALDTLTYLLLSGKKTSREYLLQANERLLDLPRIPLNGDPVTVEGEVKISLQDSHGLLSLTSLNESAVKRLIEQVSGENAGGIMAGYLDWTDRDRLIRVNGAEESYYHSVGFPYEPRNYPIQYKEEMALIKGMTKELYQKIEPSITLLPSLGFNPNTASEAVLRAYLNIDTDAARGLKEAIAQRPILSDIELFALTGRQIATDEGVYFYPSRWMELTLQSGAPDPVYTIHVGMDTRPTLRAPYTLVYWREE